MTFKDLKKLVELPSYKEQRVPTVKALEVSGVPVVAEKILENHGSISVYQNGYVIYRAHKRVTVFSLRNCVHYKYDALEGAGHHIEEEEFDEYEWHIRLVLEGEDRIFMNYEIIQGKWMPSREDREYKEEILEGVDDAVSTLERMISEERVEELLSTLTDLQRMFVIISDTDDTFNFVVSILYTQLFNLLCDKADDEHGGRLPYHVRLLLDEFANIGQIPKFDKLIATIRSREISASIILQSQSQLKTIYKDAAETIIGNCDTMLFLGGKESSTLKEISETLGKETIDLYNTSDTRGNSPSFGTNYQKTGKELMSRDELAVMDGSKCILQLRGVRPFLSDKFDITKHKRYKELSDFDKKNEFDVERYLKHELRLLTTEEFDLYEVDVTEQAQG